MEDKIVCFTKDSDRYYDYGDRELHKSANGTIIREEVFGGYERDLLEFLVDHEGTVLSRDEIIDHIKGAEQNPEAKSVNNHIGNLRKIIDKPLNATVIETVWGRGYRYIGMPAVNRKTTNPDVVTLMLSSSTYIHRDNELNDIESLLEGGKRAILLYGFGGIGKSSLAQMLCTKIAHRYDSSRWVEYHGTLKDSLLASLELYEDISDQEKRWKAISNYLKNDKSRKILFIDNVDLDIKQGQDPRNDLLLKEIAGWPYMTTIITSRISEILRYDSYKVGALGGRDRPEPCFDLFYFYYDRDELKKAYRDRREAAVVQELVERAGFHTYAIELLARSAIYEDTLKAYLDKIRERGFQFPSLLVTTNYSMSSATAAEQLRILFNLYSRDEREQKILWDFSVLPEGTVLTREEVYEWLLYDQNDLHRLCQESWLRHRPNHGFYVHPLVREVIHFDLHDGKAPQGTVEHMIQLVLNETYVSSVTSQSQIFRKLSIVEGAAKYIDFPDLRKAASFYKNLGLMEYTYARKRLTSIDDLEYTMRLYQQLPEAERGSVLHDIADVKYHLGYIKSTTQKYRSVAKNDLQETLDIWQSLDGHEADIAKAHDHLGYVLTDHPDTHERAKFHLTKALDIRRNFLEHDDSLENRRAYATTSDNLGFLLSEAGWDFHEATRLLLDALRIREQVLEETGQYATDVAWTSFNLGSHLSQDPEQFAEAEKYFRRALELRRELERQYPNTYISNIVFTLVAFAKLLSLDPSRMDEVQTMTREAIELKEKVDPEHTGYFSEQVEADIARLTALL